MLSHLGFQGWETETRAASVCLLDPGRRRDGGPKRWGGTEERPWTQVKKVRLLTRLQGPKQQITFLLSLAFPPSRHAGNCHGVCAVPATMTRKHRLLFHPKLHLLPAPPHITAHQCFTMILGVSPAMGPAMIEHVYVCAMIRRVQLFETPWTVAHQTPLSTGFSR